MGRGPTVAGQKEASAKAKSKHYTIHSKLISLAAHGGADPETNATLAEALSNARKAGVTADLIQRSIRRGAGLEKDTEKVEEIFYEGYGAGGVGIIVRTLTDNRNRTAPSIRHIFAAYGGSMGEVGSVSSFLFDYKGLITFATENLDIEGFETVILETSAEDYQAEDSTLVVVTSRSDMISTRDCLAEAGFTPRSATVGYKARSYIEVTDFDTALKIYTILAAFDEDEDVETVWNNASIEEELWQEVEAFVESKKFRT